MLKKETTTAKEAIQTNEILANKTPADTNLLVPVVEVETFKLPESYLANGYYATAENGKPYLRPELVGDHAQHVATNLSGMKPTDFNALVRILKPAKSSSLPYEAKQTAVQELLPKTMMLVSKKKAPTLLIDFVHTNIDHIHNPQDWLGFYRHMEAIAGFMTIKGGDA